MSELRVRTYPFCDIRKSNSLLCLDELAHINNIVWTFHMITSETYITILTSHKASIQIVVMWSAVHQFSHTR